MYNLLQIGKSWQICFTWDEEKKNKYKFHCSFFQRGSFLMILYLPNGVKKALGSTVSPTTEKIPTNPKVRLVVLQKKKKKKNERKIRPLDRQRQYSQTNLIRAAHYLNTVNHGSKLLTYVFRLLSRVQKKKQPWSLPTSCDGYISNEKEGKGRWEFLTSKCFPCFVLAFVCPLPMCEG